MSNVNIDVCSCCGEIWNRDNQKQISLGKHTLYLCPECYHEYISFCNKMLDQIRADIENVIQEETVMGTSGGEYEHVESKLDPEDVFQIIDSYKVKVEE